MQSAKSARYLPDSIQRPLGCAASSLIVALLLIATVFMFDAHLLPVILPLNAFAGITMIVSVYRYWEDMDLVHIRQIIAGNFRGIAEVMCDPDMRAAYGFSDEDGIALRAVLDDKDGSATNRVQGLYLENYRVGRRPSEAGLVIANLVLLLSGAAIGDVAEDQLVPSASAIPAIWQDPLSLWQLVVLLMTSIPILLAIASFLIHRWNTRRDVERLAKLRKDVQENPQEAIVSTLPRTDAVKVKFRAQLRHAVVLLTYDPSMEAAVHDLLGSSPRPTWRPSGVESIYLTVISFGLGVILGALLPPLLGLAR